MTPAVKAVAESRVRRLLSSKLIEDSFCFGRQKEKAQANKTMAIKKLYGQLLERGLGTRLHRFREVPYDCLLYTSPSPRDRQKSRMPSSA